MLRYIQGGGTASTQAGKSWQLAGTSFQPLCGAPKSCPGVGLVCFAEVWHYVRTGDRPVFCRGLAPWPYWGTDLVFCRRLALWPYWGQTRVLPWAGTMAVPGAGLCFAEGWHRGRTGGQTSCFAEVWHYGRTGDRPRDLPGAGTGAVPGTDLVF
jgi:hypothetical protein